MLSVTFRLIKNSFRPSSVRSSSETKLFLPNLLVMIPVLVAVYFRLDLFVLLWFVHVLSS